MLAQLTFPSKPKYRTGLLVLLGGIFFSLAFPSLVWSVSYSISVHPKQRLLA